MTPGKNEKRSIFGAATGRWLYHIAERATSAAVIEFLTHPRRLSHAPVIAIVLDNVSTRSSRAVERWLAAHARVGLL